MSKKKVKEPGRSNPVAKFAGKFNKAAVHRDKKNDYKRKQKHKDQDGPFCLAG